jgi:hypothetical protein
MKTPLSMFSLLTVLALLPSASGAQDAATNLSAVVANVEAVDGTVYVTRPAQRPVVLARGSGLRVGDVLNTTRNSSVRLKFTDGGETVVRPDSSLQVQRYQYQQESPASDNMLLALFKGGLRALTGAIGKRGNQDAYQLRANTATVGIRGTEFSVRLCQKDCDDLGDSEHHNSATPVAARAVQVRGIARVSRAGAAQVTLAEGQPLYSGDVLQTLLDAHVVLVFSDGTRITVNPASKMGISEYANQPQPSGSNLGSMVIDMFKGGLRFATGLIGKVQPQNIKVRTATATVGIRGTVFDLVCAPTGSADSGASAELGDMPCDESLLAQTREGLVTLSGNQGEALLLAAGQSGRVSGPNTPARALLVAPGYFQTLDTPLPEKISADLEALFGLRTTPDTSEGVLLTVHQGRVLLAQTQQEIILDSGESAYAGVSAVPVRLMTAPPILDHDPLLSGSMFRPNMCRR